MALFTKDPSKAALKVATSDPSQGVGVGTVYSSAQADQLTEEQKAARYRSGAMNIPENQQYAKGGSVRSSASKRADGIAQKGKTRGRIIK